MFAGRDELVGYLDNLADAYRLRDRIRLSTEVVDASWDAVEQRWRVLASDGVFYSARVFVPAWGQLSAPQVPQLRGLEDFAGIAFHSSRWNHDVDLAGKRVASIGAAASAVQYVPEIAPHVGQLTVFQRSANYILPRDQIVFSEQQLEAFRREPTLYEQSRDEIHQMRESSFARLLHDSSAQQGAIDEARAHREAQIHDPILRLKLTPDYEYGCKRVLRSDDYYPALQRDNVELVTEGIDRVTENGIETVDGVLREFDVIIFGTGFASQAFQGSLRIAGRNGITLGDRWGTNPEAFLGITVDGFPNMFLVYGPNTNLNHNSVMTMMEAQQGYIVAAVKHLIAEPAVSLEVDARTLREFVDEVQERLQASSFSSDCSSWYKNAEGRVINNWCGTVGEYRERTAHLDLRDYASAST
jgi:cation diffusion facilitator CzcD-associated flavoprotein CzcO